MTPTTPPSEAVQSLVERLHCWIQDEGASGMLTTRQSGELEAFALALSADRLRVLEEALRATRLELYWCQKQLAAHGQTGHPGDSVSRALIAADAALGSAPKGSQEIE